MLHHRDVNDSRHRVDFWWAYYESDKHMLAAHCQILWMV